MQPSVQLETDPQPLMMHSLLGERKEPTTSGEHEVKELPNYEVATLYGHNDEVTMS